MSVHISRDIKQMEDRPSIRKVWIVNPVEEAKHIMEVQNAVNSV